MLKYLVYLARQNMKQCWGVDNQFTDVSSLVSRYIGIPVKAENKFVCFFIPNCF